MGEKIKGYIGTYTKRKSEGIYSFELDVNAGNIHNIKLETELDRPTYVTLSKDKSYLLSVMKQDGYGGVAVFRTSNNGFLPISSTTYSEISSCHVSIDNSNDYVVVSNYHEGAVELYKLDQETEKINFVDVKRHEGAGPNKERQEGPHVHFADFTPDQRFIVVVDLGIDQIITYKIHNDTLQQVTALDLDPGSGPRHLVFHPNENLAYVVTELSSEVLTLQFNPENGEFVQVQRVPTIPKEFSDNNQCSAIRISEDGKFVYAANRGHDSIVVYRVNEKDGTLEFVEWVSTGGEWPRDFNLDPTGQYLVAANQETDSIVLFSRDKHTGKLSLKQGPIAAPEPICVMF
ncbi:lactonase family protein [Radiobacillus deserti]|uniref:Lactonase family protein n=1 Tax=Radiobacillus deserti TaxID=2594883 RepID=A0A516KF46_9BACI|nr:lactonase family protein [Radiobacillus deserti]QDP39977.1 lactonase family protein [Radiobacillus deserti]